MPEGLMDLSACRDDAVMSECGRYRYALSRALPAQLGRSMDRLLFVMLNPSTADATTDDPTIRRCIGFAKREGYGDLVIGNPYALRATDPRELDRADDPVGSLNDEWLAQLASSADLIVAAWGAVARHRENRAHEVMSTLGGLAGGEVYCLGPTATGHPRHPLYVAANQPLVEAT